jgi:hypothetical protein
MEPLPVLAAHLDEPLQMLHTLYPLGHRAEVQDARELHDRSGEGGDLSGAVHLRDERLVHLQDVVKR